MVGPTNLNPLFIRFALMVLASGEATGTSAGLLHLLMMGLPPTKDHTYESKLLYYF